MLQFISGIGLLAFVGVAWMMSSQRERINWRLVGGGLLLQFALALLILWTPPGRWIFAAMGELFSTLLGFVSAGASFVFSVNSGPGESGMLPTEVLLRAFAFGVMPTVVFLSSLMAILYHIGIMQWIVALLARLMQRTLGASGAESLAAAANIFIGQTEAPLVVRPYLAKMTQSELHAMMVGGFATISGGLMAVYAGMGIDAGHLLTASVISAPASLLISKIMQPETEEPQTSGKPAEQQDPEAVNVIEAAAIGASEGMRLVINIVAMLIAFLALIALADAILKTVGHQFGFEGDGEWTMARVLGYSFWPIAWLMGIPAQDCLAAGELLGLKIVTNEFIAYERLGSWLASEVDPPRVTPRTTVILTYALSGFSNFSSIGIQIGGIGSLAPERRSDLARFGLRAMLGGAIACCMTACVAGVLVA